MGCKLWRKHFLIWCFRVKPVLHFSCSLATVMTHMLITPLIEVTQQSQSVLKCKHLQAQPASSDAVQLNHSQTPKTHPVVFDQKDPSGICFAAFCTKWAAGPSDIDAHCWRRLCTSFKSISDDPCHSLTLILLARRLSIICGSKGPFQPTGLASDRKFNVQEITKQ